MMLSQNNDKELQFPKRKKGKFYLSLFLIFLIVNITITFSYYFYFMNNASSGNIDTSNTVARYSPIINGISIFFWILMLSFLIWGVHLYYFKDMRHMNTS